MIYSTFYCRKVSLFLKLICVVGLFVQYRENEMTGSYLIANKHTICPFVIVYIMLYYCRPERGMTDDRTVASYKSATKHNTA